MAALGRNGHTELEERTRQHREAGSNNRWSEEVRQVSWRSRDERPSNGWWHENLPGTARLSQDDALRQITKDSAHDYHVKWSPDGRTLAFASERSGEAKIWLVPAQGGNPVMLETGLSGDHHISGSVDAESGQLMANVVAGRKENRLYFEPRKEPECLGDGCKRSGLIGRRVRHLA